jgi:hypothetical protein
MANDNDKNDIGKVNLKRYETDVEGISLKTLETGLWWTKNRQTLKKILIVFLMLAGIAGWGYTIYGFGYYLFFGMNADEQMMRLFVKTDTIGQSYLNQIGPKNISLSPAGYVADGDKYDLYVQAANPNARWRASFDYCFKRPNGEKSCGHDFLLPGGKKYILALAQNFSAPPADLTFSFDSLNWAKINNHFIADWNGYQKDRLDFSITGQQFIPADRNVASEKISLNSLTFNIRNNSAYSFWEVPLTIVLTDLGRVVFLDRYPVSVFLSHDSRNIKITWPGAIGEATGIDIVPDLNILDQGIYQKPQ